MFQTYDIFFIFIIIGSRKFYLIIRNMDFLHPNGTLNLMAYCSRKC